MKYTLFTLLVAIASLSSCNNTEEKIETTPKDSITIIFLLGPQVSSVEQSTAKIRCKVIEITKDSVTAKVDRGFPDIQCEALIHLKKPRVFTFKIGDEITVIGRMWTGGYGAGWSYFIE